MIQLTPLGGAIPSAIPASQAAQRLHRDALARVRAAALAWRNGMAGLLAGLLGFSLIKGRSDISQLASPWGVAAGVLLLAALASGGFGAMRLLWAAHGRPEMLDRRMLGSGLAADAAEAAQGVSALRLGIRMSLACACLLVAAVALTWYGPPKQQPQVQVVTTSGETVCGFVTRTAHGAMTLETGTGTRNISLSLITGIQAVSVCKSSW
jgi:hypothetical protein